MPSPDPERLRGIKTFPLLVKYLKDDLHWPIGREKFDDLTFEFEPEELGIDPKTSAKIESIQQLRPLSSNQPWGIFFVKFEPKKLPVVALRRILGQLVIKKRASANRPDQQKWPLSDILFLSSYGENEQRQMTFAHFSCKGDSRNLPTLKVLDWDDSDTTLHTDHVHTTLEEKLRWPDGEIDLDTWRKGWSSAFTSGHQEVIKTSKKLAESLARLAQKIRKKADAILSIETENGPLRKLMKGFKEALIHDLTEDAFTDMYAQTIAYGLLSARITNPKGDNPDELSSQMPITNPFLKELMETFLSVGGRNGGAGAGSGIDFDELGVNEVVGLLDNSDMEAVVRDFGDKNPLEDPVIHFYELFLQEYNSQIRMERGVFYTPRPVVSFIVRSVDEVLRKEFKLEDGLADTTTWGEMAERNEKLKIPAGTTHNDPFVQILDPATGTGTFLVEVIDLIHNTLIEKWKEGGHKEEKNKQLWNDYVLKHLLPRVHGYELLMAPYAIAHMKVGLKLYETGYAFGSDERTRTYLTNALELAQDYFGRFAFEIPALANEAKAVNEIKKKLGFTVVTGNPPYSVESANKGDWIMGLMEDYKKEPGGKEKLKERNSKSINDDYVKFIHYGQHFIEKNGSGVLAFINPHGFLDNPTFRGMRWNLLKTYDKIYTLDLHGNSKKKEVCPDGSADKNVFDIMQGVSINFFIKTGQKKDSELAQVFHHDLYGARESKYQFLTDNSISSIPYKKLPNSAPMYFMVPKDFEAEEKYIKGFSMKELFVLNSVGIVTARDKFTIHDSKEEVKKTIETFLSLEDEEARTKFNLGKDTRDWQVNFAKKDLNTHYPNKGKFTKISYRPFDTRWTYYTGKSRGFHCTPRGDVMQYFLKGENIGLVFTRGNPEENSASIMVTKNIIGHRSWSRPGMQCSDYISPLYLYPKNSNQLTTEETAERTPNLKQEIVDEIAEKLGLTFTNEKNFPSGGGEFSPIDILDYTYAVLHSPTYNKKYKEFLKIDFPRVAYPKDKDTFWALVKLGGEIRQMHLLESSTLENSTVAYPHDGSNIVTRKINQKDWELYDEDGQLGRIWINDQQWVIPLATWEFYIGGYQPAQKWLKDRKGRTLNFEDIQHYQKIIVALTETDRLMGEIDKVYSPA